MDIIFCSIFLALGLFFLFANALKIPLLSTSKAVMNLVKTRKPLTKTIETLLLDTAIRLGKLIRIDKYKRARMVMTLKSADIPMDVWTPAGMLKVHRDWALLIRGCVWDDWVVVAEN